MCGDQRLKTWPEKFIIPADEEECEPVRFMIWPKSVDHVWPEAPLAAAGQDELIQALRDLDGPLDLTGLEGGAPGLILAHVLNSTGRSMLVVTPDPSSAETLSADLEFFWESKAPSPAALFPPYAHLPFTGLPAHPWTSARRQRCLWRLSSGPEPLAAVAPIQALIHRLMPRRSLSDFAELILEGEEVDRERLIDHLVAGGYAPTALVEEPGDLALRGGIIDVFGPLHDEPIRLEFFGDFVDSLRLFHPHDQRSVRGLKETVLLPMSEVILDKAALARGRQALAHLEADPAKILKLREPLTTGRPFPGIESFLPLFHRRTQGLWDYLDKDGLVCLVDPAGIKRAAEEYLSRLEEREHELLNAGRPHLPIGDIAFSWSQIQAALGARPQLRIRPLALDDDAPRLHFAGRPSRALMDPPSGKEESILAPLVKTVRHLNSQEMRPWLVCRTEGQLKRLSELLSHYGLEAFPESGPLRLEGRPRGHLGLIRGHLSAGFILPRHEFIVLTEEEALGQKRPRSSSRAPGPAPGLRLTSYAELRQGDLVVHADHGIGRFSSLINLVIDERMGDYLLLEYKDEDKLYVPADRLNLIQKYVGPEGKRPALDRLGGINWLRTKRRVRRRLMEIAKELLDLYALRQVKEGFAFSGRDGLMREFEATFEFDETPDQNAAVEDVFEDMQQPKPMDRLVCGDVGYGKTEVALRAAFRAVMDSKQVVLLVPTTVLAEQHAETFSRRLEPYPIRLEVLSRFKTPATQKKILSDLKRGLVDVVIGTHRLLQKDVFFKNLGLVIVDEEHRFGVSHKEKLKQLRRTVDVLALTATPIPRTLQMSLLNIRDLSIINTPPQHRQAITTFLSTFDPGAIQEAIGRELARGGQIFFVHNRVKDIVRVANLVQKLMPTARVEVAHGQMSERVLEKVMLKFVRQEVDVLVCTTIIESGLDIPSANTIIINNADQFGLAQIYQLRGRVGRSAEQAYAYLLIPEESTLSRDAQKRLKVLMDFTHLGAGFQIALHDLQIRGGGNLLGKAQSGHIAAVGYEMYLSLMEQAVAEIKGEFKPQAVDPEMRMPFSAFLPEHYVAEPDQRLLLYRRLAGVQDEAELEDLIAEMIDRFGPLPPEAINLTETVGLKLSLIKTGITRLDMAADQAALTFAPQTVVKPEELISLVRSAPKRFKFTPDNRLLIRAPDVSTEIKKVLHHLSAG